MPEKPTYEELDQRVRSLEKTELKLKTDLKALEGSDEQCWSILESASDGFCLLDNQGRLLKVNHAFCHMSGYSEQELLTMLIHDLDAPGAPADTARLIEKITVQGENRFESRHRRKDGSVYEVEISVQKLINRDNRFACFLRDITNRKESEKALRGSEAKMRSIFRAAPVGIGITIDRVFQEVNSRFCEITGYDQNEIVDNSVRMVYPTEEEYELVGREKYKQIENHGIGVVETRFKRKDGRVINVLVGSTPLDPTNLSVGVMFTVLDITEHKIIEDQLRQAQKMESIGRLAGGMAHDFNNMLAVILGHVDMAIKEQNTEQPLITHLEEIRKAAKHSASLTKQLLGFARKQTILPKVLDLNKTVSGMLKMLRRLIGESIQLTWLPGFNIWPVKVDPSQVDQILANLCVNARDAIVGVGHITIETKNVHLDKTYCTRHPGLVPGEYVTINVNDDGCGMEEETLRHIYEPFFTTKDIGKGTGLGLATVYGIVKQNNGYINVLSEPDLGAMVTIYFPRHSGKAEQGRANGAEGQDLIGRETILLVEDEPATLKMVAMVLKSQGFSVLVANNPKDALNQARKYDGDINLVLTDVVMPEMNGNDLVKDLLSFRPNTKHLFMSGYTSNIIAQHGVLNSDENYMQKPFSPEDLIAKIREILNGE